MKTQGAITVQEVERQGSAWPAGQPDMTLQWKVLVTGYTPNTVT